MARTKIEYDPRSREGVVILHISRLKNKNNNRCAAENKMEQKNLHVFYFLTVKVEKGESRTPMQPKCTHAGSSLPKHSTILL